MEALRACPDRQRAWEADSRNVVAPYLGQVGNGTLAPLLGANGDGFRSVSALVGPNLLGNVFSGLGGDGIAIYGANPSASAGRATGTSGHNVSHVSMLLAWRCEAWLSRLSHQPELCRPFPTLSTASSDCLAYVLHRDEVQIMVSQRYISVSACKAGRATVGMAMQLTLACFTHAGTYSVIVAIDATKLRVTVAVPCAACIGGLSPGAEASCHFRWTVVQL